MTLKDLVDVVCGNYNVTIFRDVYQPGIGTDCSCIYSGRCGNISEMIYPLKVLSIEPTADGFNVDVERMTIGEV